MRGPDLQARVVKRGHTGTEYAHLPIGVGDQPEVDRLTLAGRDAGYPVLCGPRETGDGHYERVVRGGVHETIERAGAP